MASRAPLLILSHTIDMCFFTFAVSRGIERGGVCPATDDGADSLAIFAREVRRRCVIAASTHSSQPCNVNWQFLFFRGEPSETCVALG